MYRLKGDSDERLYHPRAVSMGQEAQPFLLVSEEATVISPGIFSKGQGVTPAAFDLK